MTKHTPGPWHADGKAVWHAFRAARIDAHSGAPVALPVPQHTDETTQANARLIAAAPELLAALSAMYENYIETYGDEGEDAPESVMLARAALAKVEG